MKKHLLISIIGIETIALVVMGIALLKNSQFYRNQSMVLAETSDETTNLSADIQSCFQLPVADRPTCAKIIGTKLKNAQGSMQENIRTCMSMQPVYHRYCLEALQTDQ